MPVWNKSLSAEPWELFLKSCSSLRNITMVNEGGLMATEWHRQLQNHSQSRHVGNHQLALHAQGGYTSGPYDNISVIINFRASSCTSATWYMRQKFICWLFHCYPCVHWRHVNGSHSWTSPSQIPSILFGLLYAAVNHWQLVHLLVLLLHWPDRLTVTTFLAPKSAACMLNSSTSCLSRISFGNLKWNASNKQNLSYISSFSIPKHVLLMRSNLQQRTQTWHDLDVAMSGKKTRSHFSLRPVEVQVVSQQPQRLLVIAASLLQDRQSAQNAATAIVKA